MSFIDAPIDDTVQLDEMAAEADDDNYHNFPSGGDDVRIVGNDRCSSEEENGRSRKKEKCQEFGKTKGA